MIVVIQVGNLKPLRILFEIGAFSAKFITTVLIHVFISNTFISNSIKQVRYLSNISTKVFTAVWNKHYRVLGLLLTPHFIQNQAVRLLFSHYDQIVKNASIVVI